LSSSWAFSKAFYKSEGLPRQMKAYKFPYSLDERFLKEHLGEDVFRIASELSKKDDYSEFKLAEATGKEVNETRNLLYQLHSLNLASFIKKKDNKIGWYIYYWTFHGDRVAASVLKEKMALLETLRERTLKEERSGVFLCSNGCGTLDFDRAFEFSFHCPECGEIIGQEVDGQKVDKERLQKLEDDIKSLRRHCDAEQLKKKKPAALVKLKKLLQLPPIAPL